MGSPSWKSEARITAPAGSTISFNTLPGVEINRVLPELSFNINFHETSLGHVIQ